MNISLPSIEERQAFRQLAIDEAEARALAIQAKQQEIQAARAEEFSRRVNIRVSYAIRGLIEAVKRGDTEIFLPIDERVQGENKGLFVRAVENRILDVISRHNGYTANTVTRNYENIDNNLEGTNLSSILLPYWGVLVTWT